jgi:hypothetical protein
MKECPNTASHPIAASAAQGERQRWVQHRMNNESQVKAFEAEVKGVDRSFNTRLFVLLAIMLPVALLYERSSLKRGAIDIAFILIFGGAIRTLVA